MYLAFSLLCLLKLVSAEEPRSNGSDPIPTSLKHIATADGKAYFVDMTQRNQLEAKAYCESEGFKLATITSAAQAEALANAYSGSFYSDCWVDAEDALSVRQFVWDSTKSPVEVFGELQTVNAPYTCLAIHPFEEGVAYYRNWHCWYDKVGTLCQTA